MIFCGILLYLLVGGIVCKALNYGGLLEIVLFPLVLVNAIWTKIQEREENDRT